MRFLKDDETLAISGGISPRYSFTVIAMMAAKGTIEAFFYKVGEKVVDASGFDEVTFRDAPTKAVLENPSYAPYLLAGIGLVGVGFAAGYAVSWYQGRT